MLKKDNIVTKLINDKPDGRRQDGARSNEQHVSSRKEAQWKMEE